MKRNDVELDMREIRDFAEVVEMSVKEAQDFINGVLDDIDDLETSLDLAQGEVQQGKPGWVVIKVVP